MIKIVIRTFAGIIVAFALIVAILFCIPSTRNNILDRFASESNLYKTAISEKEDIKDTYVKNLTLLTDMRLKLKDEELKIISYQTQLSQKQDTINNLQGKLANVSTELVSANDTIKDLNGKNTSLNNQISDLTTQLNEEKAKTEQNEMLINSLNTQISILSSDIDANQSTIQELNDLKTNYETEIASLNSKVVEYQNECQALRKRIEEQETVINNLNEEIYYLSNKSLNLSFSSLNTIKLVDNEGNVKFTYGDSTTNKVDLSYLIDLDVYNLKVSYFNGSCHSIDYSDGSTRVEGSLKVKPEETAMSVFLWDPLNKKYIDFNNDNINYLIGLGYTKACYSIYAVEYSNGVVSFHFNFNSFE